MRDMYSVNTISRINADWSCLSGQSFKLADVDFRREAFGFASKIMRRAGDSIDKIIESLVKQGYRFVEPAHVRQSPEPDVENWVREFESYGVYLPIALQAWLRVVGSVDLRGSHPDWPKPGYVFEGMEETNDVYYADPLVVQLSGSDMCNMFQEWKELVETEGEVCVGPFLASISADHITKANVSGGLPYQVSTESPAVDAILFNERHCTAFTNYIRMAVCWGGFPGLDYIQGSPPF